MLWAGLVGLVIAVVCGLVARSANGRIKALESVETLPVGDLRSLHQAAVAAAGPGNFRQTSEVTGVARPHESGPLRSELGQMECVWYRHRITRKYEETYHDSDGNRRQRTKTETVAGNSSAMAFLVEDATGALAVSPGTHTIDRAEKVLDTFEPHQGGFGNQISLGPISFRLGDNHTTLGYQKEEWIVRPGARLFVHGEAADVTGQLAVAAPVEGGTFIMSARSEAELTRSENSKVLGFGIAAGVTGLAGVVLVILGLVL